jgi:DNA-binding NtrC family response regulator
MKRERIRSFMNPRRSGGDATAIALQATPASVAEKVLERKLEDIATILSTTEAGKSRLYEEVVAMVERSLFRIALMRSNHIKSAAAAYLGINRNTFQNKMVKLGIENNRE